MPSTFEEMLKNKPNLQELSQELQKQINPQARQQDDRFWYPNVDQAGNGGAVIRFLPAPANEDSPLVRIWSHRFKGPTGVYYSEKSLTTLGQKDPVGEYNSDLWNTGDDDLRKQASAQKRRLTIISNIYVIADPMNPENEGKVFLYRYGKKLWDKIDRAMNPLDPEDPDVQAELAKGILDEEDVRPAFNPYDMQGGAPLRLKIKTVGGFRNYDDSKFLKCEPIGDKKKMKEVWEQEYGLQEFVAPDKFRSYDELKAKLHTTLGIDTQVPEVTGFGDVGTVDVGTAESRVAVHNTPPKELPSDDDDLGDLEFLSDLEDEDAA